MGGRAFAVGALALALVCGGCGPPDRSPEHRIRILLEEVERAAGAKDLGTLKGVVSEGYADDRGRDKATIDGLLTAHVFRRGSLHVLVRERGIELDGPARARARVLAGLARTPVLDLADLRLPEADVYVFDVDMVEEDDGEWRVVGADWRRARPEDLM